MTIALKIDNTDFFDIFKNSYTNLFFSGEINEYEINRSRKKCRSAKGV